MPEIMAALDLNRYWGQAPYELIDRLKRAGCTHYKVHDPLPGMDLKATVVHLRKAVLPGKSAIVMFDNKECDIPSRVLKAVDNHLEMGFDLTTVHTRGGPKTLELLSKKGLGSNVVAVTMLTSDDDNDVRRLFGKERKEAELEHAMMASNCGITGGLVCGAPDIPFLRSAVTMPFMTPGIYMPGETPSPDQRSVATPKEAAHFGSSCLIVGRSIMGSNHPEKVFVEISAQLAAT